MDDEDGFQSVREAMVNVQIFRRGVRDERVLHAMRCVPRHLFVPEHLREEAYDDHPLSIGDGQTISQPYIVALMTELLELTGNESILEIGTGSGYQTAVLASLVKHVYTIEIKPALAEQACQLLTRLGYDNISYRTADGTLGWAENAPFNAILAAASGPHVPAPWLEQAAEYARLVMPLGPHGEQTLRVFRRTSEGWVNREVLPVMFVPLIGIHGWSHD